jgi:excisionase family DNA binding protein
MTDSNRIHRHPSCGRPAIPSIVIQPDGERPPQAEAQHVAGEQAPTSPAGSDRLVLTVDEAAYLLNISRGLAYELVARGELPAIRLGRRIVIPRVAMEELLGTSIR